MSDEAMMRAFAETVAAEFPDLRQILDQGESGQLSGTDVLRAMSEVLATNQPLAEKFQAKAREILFAHPPLTPDDHGGMVFHKAHGLPALNPLVEAALIERAQFDHDMPELRTGAAPLGVKPAVSVDTRARNPVALGVMLAEASEQVGVQVVEANKARLELVQSLGGDEGETLALALIQQTGQALTTQEMRDKVLDGQMAELDAVEYQRGRLPAPMKVATPTGAALLSMTPQERKQGAWNFLSTTQGRRSAVVSLAELVNVKLQGEGFDVEARPFEPGAVEPVLAAHEWTVGIDGPNSTQPAFSLIDIAAAAITKGLTRKMGDRRGSVILEVTAVNTVDVRSVGWAARLLGRDRGALT